jgi:hypothetical protein
MLFLILALESGLGYYLSAYFLFLMAFAIVLAIIVFTTGRR